jgi:plasmid maintenance system antidote protein VapI
MAFAVEKAFGISMDLLVRMQASYDTARTRGKEIKVPRYRPAHSAA